MKKQRQKHKPAGHRYTTLKQLCNLIPGHMVTNLAKKHGVDARSRTWFNQFLFSYKINPQTVFFLGYSDNYLGDEQIELTQQNRTIFLKVGYAWML